MELCIGLIALSQVAFVVVALIVAGRIERAVENTSRAIDLLDGVIKEAARTALEVREMMRGIEDVTGRLRNTSARFEQLGARAASITSSVLDEVEAPVRTAVAVSRGVRKGVAVVIDRLVHRGNAVHNGV
jgi:hypothetical protein